VPIEHVQTLVIGGGQAGLAMSHRLTQRGLAHLVLERYRSPRGLDCGGFRTSFRRPFAAFRP